MMDMITAIATTTTITITMASSTPTSMITPKVPRRSSMLSDLGRWTEGHG